MSCVSYELIKRWLNWIFLFPSLPITHKRQIYATSQWILHSLSGRIAHSANTREGQWPKSLILGRSKRCCHGLLNAQKRIHLPKPPASTHKGFKDTLPIAKGSRFTNLYQYRITHPLNLHVYIYHRLEIEHPNVAIVSKCNFFSPLRSCRCARVSTGRVNCCASQSYITDRNIDSSPSPMSPKWVTINL